jgi:hypothetical protein
MKLRWHKVTTDLCSPPFPFGLLSPCGERTEGLDRNLVH